MSMRINTNQASMSALKNISRPKEITRKALEQLSSGKRIPNAGEDAAGLALASRMDSEVQGFEQARRNVSDGISLVRTGEGAQQQVANNLQRIRELSVQANNGTLNTSDQEAIQQEIDGLTGEIERISRSTSFNGQQVLDGSLDTTIQAGDQPGDQVEVKVESMDPASLGLENIDVTTPDGSQAALTAADQAIDQVSAARADLGTTEQQLKAAFEQLGTAHENRAAAASRIMDVDLARATADLTRGEILAQSSISMIVKSGQLSNQALGLLE